MTDQQRRKMELSLEIAAYIVVMGTVFLFLLGVYALADLVL